MIQIYSEWNTDYDHNGDAVFDPINCTVDMELNGSWELTLEVPLDEDGKFQLLAVNAVISAPTPVGENQLFRIYNTEKTEDSAIAYARPIFLDSARDVFLVDTRPTNLTGQEALDYLMDGTPYSGTSDIQLQMTAYYVRKNLIEALAGTEDNSFLSRWGGEIIYDNYNVDISVRQGEDRGLRVEFGRNIESIQEIIDVDSMVTRIVPVAFNGYTLDGDEPWVDSPIIDNYPIVYAKEINFSDIRLTEDVTEGSDIVGYDTLEELREALKEQCANQFEDGVDKPSITYEINMTDLARTDLYADFKGLETVELGDTVHCYHRILGIETDARVIELVYDCAQRAITQITIGDYVQDYWENLNASISAAATTVDFDSVSTKIAYIESNYIRTNELEADIANLGFLTATEAELTYAKITDLDAALISVNELLADYAKIDYVNATFLTADSAVIENLSVFAESVYTLLGGIGSFGTLDSIHLSSDNAVIDEAVIVEAIAGTVIADILNAGYINTDEITIKSDSGGYITSGATTQYFDSEGNIRIQIGLDESGNFTFILYDADGEGILIDEKGIRASAVPDGLIVDSMVAETAAIQGSKIDMVTLTSCLNEYGQLVMDASKVTLDDQTLDVWYTKVTQTLEGLEGLTAEGLMQVIPYFALGDSPTEPPPYDGGYTASLLGTMELGNTLLGVSESESRWTTEPLTAGEGEYLWVCFQGLYADSHTEWTTPYCLTDGYLRTETSTLQTEFSVVQGQISSRIWKTDITEALDEYDTTIEEQFSDVNQTIGNITSVVGEIETSYGEISARVTSVEQTAQGLISSVADVQSSLDNGMETLESEIEQLAGSISMSVTSSESGTASIVLTVDGEEAGSGTFVSEARTAFERENTAIIISAGTVTFNDNLLIVNGTNFTLDAEGNATFAGELKAPGGTIGGFTIGETELYRNATSFDDYTQGAVYVGNNGIRVNGQYFQVRISGQRSGETYQGMSFFYYNGIASEMSEALLCGMIRTAYSSSTGDRVFEISDGNNVYFLSCDTYSYYYGTGQLIVGSTSYVLSLYGSTIYGLSAIATVSELSINDGASTLAAPNFRDPGHDMMANLVSHTYEVEGKQHVGLAVDEVEAAMQAAGMNPDEYDITDRWMDEDGTEKGAIRYDELIPMLISEIQSINSRLDALEEA